MALTKVRGSGLDGATALKGQELVIDADGDTSIEASSADDIIVVDTAGSERMRIDADGNVGIGDSSPESNTNFIALTVTSTASSGGGQVYVQSSSVNSVFGADNTGDPKSILQTVTNHPLTLGTNNTERMRIRADGVIVLGSSAINTTSTTVASRGSRFAINQGNASGFAIAIDNVRNDTSSSGGILITNNETSGTFDLMSFLSSGDSEIGSINTNNSSTSFNTSSDYRLKENVVTDWDATTRLKQLKPSRFNFIADADITVDGFLAHEVSSIVPEAITGEKDAVDEDGNIKTQKIDQSKLVPLLTKALQEAVAKIETLEAKVTALENA
tara:strand:+ start:10 stop:996 length:987 start_codon:yes stop_codon:yes gene_type:complete